VTSLQRVENPQYWHRFNTERRIIAQQVTAYLKAKYCTPQDLKLGLKEEWQTELSSLGGPGLMKEANEVYLFHGSEKWLDISQTGFEVKYAGSNKGSAYGRGIYFAESPSKVSWYLPRHAQGNRAYSLPSQADQYNRGSGPTHRLVLTRVVLGVPHVTKEAMNVILPPHVKGGGPNRSVHCLVNVFILRPGLTMVLLIRHHSIVAQPGGGRFREFVVFDNNKTYPEFIIEYQRV